MFALCTNTTNNDNIAIGYSALKSANAQKNIGIGNCALLNVKESTCLDYFGCGRNNVAMGFCSLKSLTYGGCNIAIGSYSQAAATGTYCDGQYANWNISIGYKSLFCNTFGYANTALGDRALENNTKHKNTAIGSCALNANTTGTGNVAVGFGAQCTLASGVNNTITIGNNSVTSATTGHTAWGTASNNVLNCVWAAWTVQSDARDKTNVETLGSNLGLGLIKKLRPVSFNWDNRDNYVRECGYEYGTKDGTLVSEKKHYGLIAQELKGALEELNVTFDALHHDEVIDSYRITYEELIAPIIKAIQEIDSRLTKVDARVTILEN
jgi:hypothetical protein